MKDLFQLSPEPSFTLPYHFHLLTNIQTFYLQLCMWDNYHIFLTALLVFTRLLLNEIYHLIKLLFDWLMWCWFLFAYLLIWFEVFVIVIWHWKPVDSNSHWLTFLYYKRTDSPSVLVTPNRGYSWFLCFTKIFLMLLKIFLMLLVSLFRLKLVLFFSALKESVLWTLKSRALIILDHTSFLWGEFKVF